MRLSTAIARESMEVPFTIQQEFKLKRHHNNNSSHPRLGVLEEQKEEEDEDQVRMSAGGRNGINPGTALLENKQTEDHRENNMLISDNQEYPNMKSGAFNPY